MPASTTLNYAPRPPWYQCRWPIRRLIAALVLLTLATAFWFHDPLWLEARARYAQLACAYRHAPPDQVVWTNRPDLVNRLSSDPRYRPLTAFNHPAVVLRTQECWKRWRTLSRSSIGEAISFFGTMRTPSGEPRLVAVAWNVETQHALSFQRKGWFTVPARVKGQCLATIYYLIEQHPGQLVFYPASLDSDDPSHLTIPFDCAGKPGQVHLRLRNNGTFSVAITL